jgi:hypothetical protein
MNDIGIGIESASILLIVQENMVLAVRDFETKKLKLIGGTLLKNESYYYGLSRLAYEQTGLYFNPKFMKFLAKSEDVKHNIMCLTYLKEVDLEQIERLYPDVLFVSKDTLLNTESSLFVDNNKLLFELCNL